MQTTINYVPQQQITSFESFHFKIFVEARNPYIITSKIESGKRRLNRKLLDRTTVSTNHAICSQSGRVEAQQRTLIETQLYPRIHSISNVGRHAICAESRFSSISKFNIQPKSLVLALNSILTNERSQVQRHFNSGVFKTFQPESSVLW